MKPTVTASVWNYCNNHCSYCVAGSNDPKWRPKPTFEIWKPEGFQDLNDHELRVRFGTEYYHELCPDKNRYLNAADVLSFEHLIDWLDLYRPGATVHLSGGEPLLRPDIAFQTTLLLAAGYTVVMFTNGQLIHERPELLDLPIKWCVTFHQQSGLSVDDFLAQIEPLRERPLIVHTVISTFMEAKALSIFEHRFAGYRFYEKWNGNAARTMVAGFRYDPSDLAEVASRRLTLVTPDGAVYPCNTCRIGPIGNIYRGTCDDEKASLLDASCRECVQRNACSAYQTAALLETA